jgi:hypothetical protein
MGFRTFAINSTSLAPLGGRVVNSITSAGLCYTRDLSYDMLVVLKNLIPVRTVRGARSDHSCSCEMAKRFHGNELACP